MNKIRSLIVYFILSICACPLAAEKPADNTIIFPIESAETSRKTAKNVFTASTRRIRVSKEEAATVDAFFKKLGKATRHKNSLDAREFFSSDAMIDAMKSSGQLNDMSEAQISAFKKAMSRSIQSLSIALKMMSFDRHKIFRIDVINKKELEVFTRLYDDESNITTQLRWWIIQTEQGWRIYDFEDLQSSLRIVRLMGVMMKAGLTNRRHPWFNQLGMVVAKMQQIDMNDPTSLIPLRKPLENLKGHKLPKEMKRFVSVLYVSCLMQAGELENATKELKASKKGGYDSPIYHFMMGTVLFDQAKYEAALKEFEKHATLLGWDSDALEMKAESLIMLERLPEARKAAIAGLEDNPQAIDCLNLLVESSSPKQIQEAATASFFKAYKDPEEAYEYSLEYLLDIDQEVNAESLFQVLKREFPKSELIPDYAEYFQSEKLEKVGK